MRSDSIRARSCGNDDREGRVGMVGGEDREKREEKGGRAFSDLQFNYHISAPVCVPYTHKSIDRHTERRG